MWGVQSEETATENMGVRTDRRQWLIYDRLGVTATVRALEVLALGIVGRSFESHPVMAVRALGNAMSKIADARTRHMLGLIKGEDTTDQARAAVETIVQLSGWLAGERPEPEGLDDLYGAVFWFDSRLNGAGLSGSGWLRDLGTGV